MKFEILVELSSDFAVLSEKIDVFIGNLKNN